MKDVLDDAGRRKRIIGGWEARKAEAEPEWWFIVFCTCYFILNSSFHSSNTTVLPFAI